MSGKKWNGPAADDDDCFIVENPILVQKPKIDPGRKQTM